MFWRHKKKMKRWRDHYDVACYSTPELETFLEVELALVTERAQPVHQHLARAARLETEIARRSSQTTIEKLNQSSPLLVPLIRSTAQSLGLLQIS
jgi:hypothetical protein